MDKREELEQYLSRMRNGTNREAINTIDKLRNLGWLKDGTLTEADLSQSNLHSADLSGANLSLANLSEANLVEANLPQVDMSGVDLYRADLSEANLTEADLSGARIRSSSWIATDLYRAELTDVDAIGANFSSVDLELADFTGAILNAAIFSGVIFKRTRLAGAHCGSTIFANVDLSDAIGLELIQHWGPSTIGFDTLIRSGELPKEFLKGCGVPDAMMTYLPSIRGDAIEFFSCFISYSSKDEDFAKRLHTDLQDNGVRCWFAPRDMKTGDPVRPTIDEAIRIRDKLLLVLSEHSLESNWVEKEVETAFEEEIRRDETVLFPIRLDDTVMETSRAWAADVRRKYHIGDFRHWEDEEAYSDAFSRLLRDLKATQ